MPPAKGMILLMGKHQFLISSVDDGTLNKAASVSSDSSNNNAIEQGEDFLKRAVHSVFFNLALYASYVGYVAPAKDDGSDDSGREKAVMALMGDAEQLLQVLEGRSSSDQNEIDQR